MDYSPISRVSWSHVGFPLCILAACALQLTAASMPTNRKYYQLLIRPVALLNRGRSHLPPVCVISMKKWADWVSGQFH